MKKTVCLLLAVLSLALLCACEDSTAKSAGFAPFSVKGVTVSLDAEAAPIIASLGTPTSSAETGSCYGDGKDKIYQYTSYKIQTYSSVGKEYILSVEIYDDANATLATPEGAKIGMTVEEVLAKQGTPTTQTAEMIVYTDSNHSTKLQFRFADGKVNCIQYLKAE